MNQRLHPADRSEQILFAAVEIAEAGHLYTMDRLDIGTKAMCARTLINHYYKSLEGLREHVIRWAIRNDNAAIMAQALLKDDPLVNDMTHEQLAVIANHIKESRT